MYGNIGQVSCLMSTLMGGVSGSAVADASMECRILGPEMTRLGYDRGWSAAINGLSGLIVATIPPSMGLIIYGTVGEVSIGRLFMAGWVPGILMCVLLMLAVTWSARRFGYKPEHDHPAPLSEILKALLDSIWAILFPVLLVVLIRFGIMSPTESGSFACAYALLVGTEFYHELTWESLLQTLRDSVEMALRNYFAHLEGADVTDVYNLVLTEVEAPLLETVMNYVKGNQTKASELLGLNRGTLRKKLKQYDLL